MVYMSDEENEISLPVTALEADDETDFPSHLKFQWINRLGCVEILAAACVENGGGFERAFRTIRIRNYSRNADKMPVKQITMLKRDVTKRAKDIQHNRESADVGDLVKVPKYVPAHPLLGGYKREGTKLVEALVEEVRRTSSASHYRVKRIKDGQTQEGNGHMIKAIVRKAEVQGGEDIGVKNRIGSKLETLSHSAGS